MLCDDLSQLTLSWTLFSFFFFSPPGLGPRNAINAILRYLLKSFSLSQYFHLCLVLLSGKSCGRQLYITLFESLHSIGEKACRNPSNTSKKRSTTFFALGHNFSDKFEHASSHLCSPTPTSMYVSCVSIPIDQKHIYTHMYTYIYIHIDRERERRL